MARLPDGRFHVRSGGQEVALPPAQAAQAVGLPLADFESRMAQATQAALAAPRPAAGMPGAAPLIWQGRARHGDYAEVLSRNPDGTFQIRVDGKEWTRTERDVAYMTGLTKAPLYAMLAKATEGRIGDSDVLEAQPANEFVKEPLESRWGHKPLPAGADSEIAKHWREKLESKRVSNPMAASDVFVWVEGRSFQDLRFETERAAQSLFDLLPREILEKVGKINVEMVKRFPNGVVGKYNAYTNTLSISLEEYNNWKGSARAENMRELIWHELGHWLYYKAGAHPRLQDWKQAIRLHWLKRVQGQPIEISSDGWRFIRDGWLSDYAGRLYPDWAGGVEIPSVYLEEVSMGPENIAYHCREKHQTETFDIVTSLFGPL